MRNLLCGHPNKGYSRNQLRCMSCLRLATADRFDSLVDRSSGPDACWPWMGRLNDGGYGVWGRGSASRHVLAVKLGRPVEGDTRHTCDNRACCNPAHLIEGTRAENMQDMIGRGRAFRGSPSEETRRRMSANSAKRKLSHESVARIKADLITGSSLVALAETYGVAPETISSIKHGRSFKLVALASVKVPA